MSAGKLPEGWVDTQLGNVIEYGKTSKKDLSDVNGETWVLELEDIEKDSSKILNKVIASNRPFKSTKNSFKKGDVLYGKLRPYLNKVIMANDDGVCTTEIIPINAEPACCNKYLFFWLKSSTFLGYVSDVSYGVNMPRLGTSDGLKAPLRLAPLAEQKIIAEKLDTLLAQVDSTKARLEKIPKILKRFRQAVLGAAVSGKLTEHWRNEQGINLSDWGNTTFEEICTEITVGYVGKMIDRYKSEGVPFLRSQNIREFKFSNKNLLYVSDDFHKEIFKSRLSPGDLAIVRSGAPGTTCVIPDSLPIANCSDLVIARPSDKLNSYFGCIFMNSNVAKINVLANRVGIAQQHFNVGSMKKMPIHLPPLLEQNEIVHRVEQLFAYADTIEKQVDNALSRANNLTQSILAKAFQGELTAEWRAENLELISGENSAAALLEKIKGERAASTGKKASRKKS